MKKHAVYVENVRKKRNKKFEMNFDKHSLIKMYPDDIIL